MVYLGVVEKYDFYLSQNYFDFLSCHVSIVQQRPVQQYGKPPTFLEYMLDAIPLYVQLNGVAISYIRALIRVVIGSKDWISW